MNQSSLGIKGLKLLYYRHKDSKMYGALVLAVILLIGFLLVWMIVMPQIQKYISIQDEINTLSKKVALLHSNLDLVKNTNPQEVDNDLQTALSALPSDKDFEGMLTAISNSALRSGIALDDFKLSIGKLATESGSETKGIPIKLGMKSNMESAVKFIGELNQKVPVSDLAMVQVSNDEGAKGNIIDVTFYYKPLANVIFRDDAPIPHLTNDEKELLRQVKTWKDQTTSVDAFQIVASASAL
jgi:Tfp pilus assembly protein PilO